VCAYILVIYKHLPTGIALRFDVYDYVCIYVCM